MVKYIIKRIIIGTGIALALMFIKGNLLMTVDAMTVQNATPTSMYMVDYNGTQSNMNMTTFSFTGLNLNLYGRSFTSDVDRFYFYYNFDNNSHLDISQPLDMHLVMYANFKSNLNNPYRVFIVDANHNAYTCLTEGASRTYNNSNLIAVTGYYTDVYCSNIALSHGTFKLYIGDSFSTNQGDIGISKITVYKHGSNQDVVNAVNNNTSATNAVNDSLNDDSIDEENAEQAVEDLDTMISSNSNVSDLITMPITMFQTLVNSLDSRSCSSISLGSLYGHNLTLPCIRPSTYLGSGIVNTIDLILCGLFALVIRKKVVDIFNNITSLKDRGNEFE